jgi:ABC-type sugar transport system permease subunit
MATGPRPSGDPWHAWRRLSPWKRSEYLAAALFLAPGLTWFWTFMMYPLLHSLWMSFHEWKIRGAERVRRPRQLRARVPRPHQPHRAAQHRRVRVISVPPQMVLGLLVAICLERVTSGKVASGSSTICR